MDVEALEATIVAYLGRVLSREPGDGYSCAALDGKALRGTFRLGRGVHLLAIYLPAEGLVLAQAEIGIKANEISAAPGLLAQVDLEGLVITADAMFTRRSLCLQITSGQGDYVLAVKENQPRLLEAIKTLFAPKTPLSGTGLVPTNLSTPPATTGGTDGQKRAPSPSQVCSRATRTGHIWHRSLRSRATSHSAPRATLPTACAMASPV